MKELVSSLFDTGDWPARWVCGKWDAFHGWMYIGSDVAIWLAYFIIPVILIWFIQRRPDVPFLPVFWLFGAFIILCGTTHLIDALSFWWPGYRLSALVRFVTAVVSFITVFALVRDLPKALDLAAGAALAQGGKDETVEQAWKQQVAERDTQIRKLTTEIAQMKGSS